MNIYPLSRLGLVTPERAWATKLKCEFKLLNVHFLAVDPLVLAKLGVKEPLLKPLEFDGEAWSELLEPRSRPVLFFAVNIAVVAHKDEISLVVKGDHLPAFKLRLVGEERAEEATGATAEPSDEIVENEFWDVRRGAAVAGDGGALLKAAQAEKGSGPRG